jgi:hypothetical protein
VSKQVAAARCCRICRELLLIISRRGLTASVYAVVAGSVVRGITKDCASSADSIVPVVLGDDATVALESKQVSADFLRRVCSGCRTDLFDGVWLRLSMRR